MSILSSGFSAIGRLVAIGLIAAAFLFGMAGVVYMSLQGKEVKVPEITGKDMPASEQELASLGLKIKKRADRFSQEAPGTVIEQLPKSGETVKTGQMILVVTSKGPGEGDQPASLKTSEAEDTEKIEEMISDKPKKPKANSNTNKKKADTARDVNSESSNSKSNSNSESDPPESNSSKKESGAGSNTTKPKANTQTPATRLPNPSSRPGDTRPRAANRP